jgi:hypothetical protein
MRGQELPEDQLHPKRFELGLGNYLGLGFELTWNGTGLEYRLFDLRFADRASGTVTPSPDDWQQFWSSLDLHDLWSWPETHPSDVPSPSSGSWSVHIEGNDKRVRSSGANLDPAGASLATPPNFHDFLEAVRQLIGGLELLGPGARPEF